MSPTSIPLLTPPSSPITPPPLTTWERSRPADADQLLAEFRNTHLPQLLDAAQLTPAQRDEALAWSDDACLQRYLGARDFHLAPAVKMLQETVSWRVQYGLTNASNASTAKGSNVSPASVTVAAETLGNNSNGTSINLSNLTVIKPPPIGMTLTQVKNEARDGNNYVNGFDKYGRPIIYLKKRSKPHDVDANVRLLVFTLEHAISLMPAGVQQVVLILDLSKYSRANSPPLHVSRQTLHILTTYYPERLGMAYIVNAPAVFSLLWNVVYPFLNHVTREKMRFVNVAKSHGAKGGQGKNEILDDVDRHVLESAYGGDFEFVYDYDAYWKLA